MENKKEQLVLKMLGGYTLTYGEKPIILGRGNLTKSVQLLQLLLLHIDTGITKEDLGQALYDWEDVLNTNNSLNSMIYRLKNQLVMAGMPKEEYISIKNGICRWTGSMPVQVDVVEFEKCVESAANADGNRKRELLERALSLYRGELLPLLSSELWVTVESVRLKKLYMSAILQLCEILEAGREYTQMLEIYKSVAEMYPFDEWQEKQIDTLQKMERFDDAFRVYQDTVRLYSEELGAPPSLKMRELLQKMNGKLLNSENDFMKIRSRLREEEWKNGAYDCAYPSFVDTYRLMCRIAERSKQSIHLMACKVYGNGSDEKLDKAVGQTLGRVIGDSLRRGDAYTRYSESQYLILLSSAAKESFGMIFERIRGKFEAEKEAEKEAEHYHLEYEVIEVKDFSNWNRERL